MAPRTKKMTRPAEASKRADGANREWIWGLLLALAVLLAYQPVWYAGYIWDDETVLTNNPVIVGPLGLKEIWTTSAADICPLTLSTFWLEQQIWGLDPLPYHVVNVLLQALCAVLLWRVLLALRIPGAWLGASLWALHPVQVESVAWITEMKNTESGCFYLLAVLFFVKSLRGEGNSPRTYFAALLFAALAMAAKSSTVILPIALCLVAWWMEGRWRLRYLAKSAPIFAMSLLAGAVSLWTQQVGGANESVWARSWPLRLAEAGDAVWFYLGKLVFPYPLITIYPHWRIDTGDWISYVPLVLAVVLLGVLWHGRDRWARPWFFAYAYFLVALLPGLGLLSNYIFRYGSVFDHLQYLASMGPLALAGAALLWLGRALEIPARWRPIVAGALVLTLGIASWGQAWIYENKVTLWTHTLEFNPDCSQAYNNLGIVLSQIGRSEEVAASFQKAVTVDSQNEEAHYNLGVLLAQHGQVNAAIEQLQAAVTLFPGYANAQNNLGVILAQKGETDRALPHYLKALEINPNWPEAHSNLGAVYAQKGDFDKAIAEFGKALALSPTDARAHTNLGNALLHDDRVDEAITEFQTALAYTPNFPQIHFNYGNALEQKGRIDDAVEQYQEALRLDPGYQKARDNLERLRSSMRATPAAK
jgi:tetratricopeptide (TPR) repeat protein